MMLHASVTMIPNPMYGKKEFAGRPEAMFPYMRAGKGVTYRCRQGQVRGKAALKAAKRARQRARG